jgi:uncharacterized RDD family membrane protein YckC
MVAYYYYGRDAQVSGPVELEALAALLLQRSIDEQTPLWSEQRDWSALGEALPQFNPPALEPAPAAPLSRALPPAPVQPQAMATEAGWHLDPQHPWRRWLARLIDHFSMGLLAYVVLAIAIYSWSDDIAASEVLLSNNLVASMAVALLCVPLCALCIGLSGTTPGKWCAGVRVTAREGGTLGLRRALRRELRVWATGLGLGIPLVSQMCELIAWSDLARSKHMAWDEALGAVVQYRDPSLWGTVRLAIAAALVLALIAALLGIDFAHLANTP